MTQHSMIFQIQAGCLFSRRIAMSQYFRKFIHFLIKLNEFLGRCAFNHQLDQTLFKQMSNLCQRNIIPILNKYLEKLRVEKTFV